MPRSWRTSYGIWNNSLKLLKSSRQRWSLSPICTLLVIRSYYDGPKPRIILSQEGPRSSPGRLLRRNWKINSYPPLPHGWPKNPWRDWGTLVLCEDMSRSSIPQYCISKICSRKIDCLTLCLGYKDESKLNCKRQGVCDLPVAMTLANILVDCKIVVPPPSIKTQVKGNKET